MASAAEGLDATVAALGAATVSSKQQGGQTAAQAAAPDMVATQQREAAAAEAEEGEEEGAADYLSASSGSGSGFSDGSLVYEQEQASPNVQQGVSFAVHSLIHLLQYSHTSTCATS